MNDDGKVDQQDRTVWVEQLKRTYFGDANLDGQFNTADFVVVFQAGEYEDALDGNSTWSTGDWNGDGDFDSVDFVVAFQDGGFERGPRAANAVPEPTSLWTLLPLLLITRLCRQLVTSRRRQQVVCDPLLPAGR